MSCAVLNQKQNGVKEYTKQILIQENNQATKNGNQAAFQILENIHQKLFIDANRSV